MNHTTHIQQRFYQNPTDKLNGCLITSSRSTLDREKNIYKSGIHQYTILRIKIIYPGVSPSPHRGDPKISLDGNLQGPWRAGRKRAKKISAGQKLGQLQDHGVLDIPWKQRRSVGLETLIMSG